MSEFKHEIFDMEISEYHKNAYELVFLETQYSFSSDMQSFKEAAEELKMKILALNEDKRKGMIISHGPDPCSVLLQGVLWDHFGTNGPSY